jgi:hypothetical protein
LSTLKFAKRLGGWVAWSSGVTGPAFVAAHLHPRRQDVVFGIAVGVCASKLICSIAVLQDRTLQSSSFCVCPWLLSSPQKRHPCTCMCPNGLWGERASILTCILLPLPMVPTLRAIVLIIGVFNTCFSRALLLIYMEESVHVQNSIDESMSRALPSTILFELVDDISL